MVLCSLLLCLSGFSPVVSYAYDEEFDFNITCVNYVNNPLPEGVHVFSSDDVVYDDELGYFTFLSSLTEDVYAVSVRVDGSTFEMITDAYDYYFIGTLYSDVPVSECSFAPNNLGISIINCDDVEYKSLERVKYYHHDNVDYTGFTIVGKMPDLTSSSISYIDFIDSTYGTLPASQVNLKMQIVRVEKSDTSELDLLIQISDKLDEINESINNNAADLNQSINDGFNELKETIEEQYSTSNMDDFYFDNVMDAYYNEMGGVGQCVMYISDFLDIFSSSAVNSSSTVLTFPGFSIDVDGVNYQVWNDYEFDLTILHDYFPVLMHTVNTVCTIVVYGALVNYCIDTFYVIFMGTKE